MGCIYLYEKILKAIIKMYLENFTGTVTGDSTTNRLLELREKNLWIIGKTPVTGHGGGF